MLAEAPDKREVRGSTPRWPTGRNSQSRRGFGRGGIVRFHPVLRVVSTVTHRTCQTAMPGAWERCRSVPIAGELSVMVAKTNATHGQGMAVVPRTIEERILLIRGVRVMLDRDLAELYGAATGTLNQAVTRNTARFPSDFAFKLTPGETANII